MFPNGSKKISEFTRGDFLEIPVKYMFISEMRIPNTSWATLRNRRVVERKDRGAGIPRRGSSQEGAKFIIVTPDRDRQARSTREKKKQYFVAIVYVFGHRWKSGGRTRDDDNMSKVRRAWERMREMLKERACERVRERYIYINLYIYICKLRYNGSYCEGKWRKSCAFSFIYIYIYK